MKVRYGKGTTKYGPGVSVELSGCDVAVAIDAYLVAKGIHVSGPRTIRVNGELCECGSIYVDPSGFVIKKGQKYSGRGPEGECVMNKESFDVESTVRRNCAALSSISRRLEIVELAQQQFDYLF